MRCAKCGTESTSGKKFCATCGRPLPRGCPNCGADNAPTSAFCEDWGTALAAKTASATARAAEPRSTNHQIRVAAEQADVSGAADGERKLVTALFADIKGSTELMERP